MARLTKADRRRAALKGWRNRKRANPRRKPGSRRSTGRSVPSSGWSSAAHQRAVWDLGRQLRFRDSSLSKEQSWKLAAKELEAPERERFPRHFQNPPSGFIPCKAVKITRNGGKVEVRIRK
jgi:hypothetical protein